MEYRDLEMLEKHACEELKHYAQEGFRKPDDVHCAKALMSIVYKATELMERDEGQSMAMSRGYSGAGRWNANGVFGDRPYGDGGSYGYSMRRGRNSMGQYTSYAAGDMAERLEQMLQETTNPKEREALERALRDFR